MDSFWILTKDLRLEDNNVLKTALQNSNMVYPIFIYDENQIKSGGINSLHFLFESLQDLNNQLGQYISIVEKSKFIELINTLNIKNAFILKGFTTFEKTRNFEYSNLLNLIEIDDVLGMPREFFLKNDGTPYRVFTPYSKSILTKGGLPLPDMNIPINLMTKIKSINKFDFLSLKLQIQSKPIKSSWNGGSTEGKVICQNRYYNLQVTLYERQHNLGVTNQKKERKDISPHVKFGTVSARLVYHCGLVEDSDKDHTEARGILWRALYYTLMDNNLVYLKQRNIIWYNDMVPESQWRKILDLWSTGNTGFDFVDAGINQLLRTGSMDNEVRMLVANFLVFVLGINWRYGEEFFRKHLVDYDWPLNLGNWAWCAQIGLDNPSPNKTYNSKPIRIFNPNTYKTKTKSEKNYRDSYIQKWLTRPQNSLQQIYNFETAIRYWLQFY